MYVVRPICLVRHALLAGGVLHALADKHLGLGVQHQIHTQRPCRALARVVVGGGANPAAREDDIG